MIYVIDVTDMSYNMSYEWICDVGSTGKYVKCKNKEKQGKNKGLEWIGALI